MLEQNVLERVESASRVAESSQSIPVLPHELTCGAARREEAVRRHLFWTAPLRVSLHHRPADAKGSRPTGSGGPAACCVVGLLLPPSAQFFSPQSARAMAC